MLSKLLLDWYDLNARSLPWRGTANPYRIWLSEIMLQQTRTEAVIPYYERFLKRFPDVHALAAADEETVLKLWEGLGYYSRARNLHRCARIVSERGGAFPSSVEALQALPGIGPYAARAIASIAHNVCAPALDGNQMRVISRIFAVERVLKTPFDLESEALSLIPEDRPGDYNQALMDLGAAICTPRSPSCAACPIASLCRAHREENPERYPIRPAPVVKREERRTVLLIFVDGKICIRKRASKGLLANFWEFPSLDGFVPPEELQPLLEEAGFTAPTGFMPLGAARHIFTHLIWRMQGWQLRAEAAPADVEAVALETLRSRPFPGALRVYRKIAEEMLASGEYPS